eukprot:gnl/TRDRNA2_/TRDRNA2_69025_c0_seq1.p1 gnl/TRDRNA2_/TRDRNA2_69025_c0~~gnl/TRDRNA2_/TRDRNA2_69025_c0_seq1.p1  ORF type:complete len:268 (-),score=63.44 gnl/TRDRNA2_/TRDRNA2_69025_c0_seq1:121-924(-)
MVPSPSAEEGDGSSPGRQHSSSGAADEGNGNGNGNGAANGRRRRQAAGDSNGRDLKELLERLELGDFLERIRGLGVTHPADISTLFTEDFEAQGMTRLQVRQLQRSVQQQSRRPGSAETLASNLASVGETVVSEVSDSSSGALRSLEERDRLDEASAVEGQRDLLKLQVSTYKKLLMAEKSEYRELERKFNNLKDEITTLKKQFDEKQQLERLKGPPQALTVIPSQKTPSVLLVSLPPFCDESATRWCPWCEKPRRICQGICCHLEF